MKTAKFRTTSVRLNKGFTFIELLIVLAVVAILAVIGIPSIQSTIISGKVEPTANDLRIGIASMRKNFNTGSAPYATLGSGATSTAVFANMIRGPGSTLTVAGTGNASTVQHTIGAAGAQVTVASDTLASAGDSFSITVPNANVAACPDLSAMMSRTSDRITLNGTVVKAINGNYDSSAAANACTSGDTNTFVFTVR